MLSEIKINILPSQSVCIFLRILAFKFISQPQKSGTKATTRQLAKIRLERKSQSKGSSGRP